MPEKLLNGLLHLFAILASTRGQEGVKNTLPVLEKYLHHNLGLRNIDDYIGLFEAVADLYLADLSPTAEVLEEKIEYLSTLLSPHLVVQEQYAFLIYFLEIRNAFPEFESSFDKLILRFAHGFNLKDQTLSGFKILNAHNPDMVDPEMIDDTGLFIFPPAKDGSPPKEQAPLFQGSFMGLFSENIQGAFIAPVSRTPLFLDGNSIDNKMIKFFSEGSVLSNGFGQSLYFSELLNLYSKKDESGIVFQGENLNFCFPGSANGLHDFSFQLKGGDFVGIMGASGAGKSTLMNLLNGSMSPDSGVVSINSVDIYKDRGDLDGLIGFVPQDDLLFEDLTVNENLDFAAQLCLSHLDSQEREKRVVSMLTELKQLEIANLKVGSPTEKTISGGQRKRLNIALELIRRPRILFVDEPTSGLSSGDSENVMGLLKAQTTRGSIVLVVIHQPSSALYRMFDRLWLLDTGGYPIFDGHPIEAVQTFREESQIAGSEQCICQECGNVNPEQLFNLIEARKPDSKGTFTQERQVSPEQWHHRYKKNAIKKGPQSLALEDQKAQTDANFIPEASDCLKRPGKIKQTLIFTWRNFKNRLSNYQYAWVNLLVPILLGTLSALLCLGSTDGDYTFRDNPNIPTFFFVSVIFALFFGLNTSGEEILKDARTLLREKFLHLSWGGYVISKFLFLGVLNSVQMGLFLLPSYLILELPTDIFIFWGILFSLAMVSCSIGLNISASFKNASAIYILIPLILIPQILLCGSIIPFEELISKTAAHRNVPLVANLTPSRWGYEALLLGQFTKNPYREPFLEYEMAVRQAEYVLDGVIPELRSLAEAPFLMDPTTGKERKNPDDFKLLRNELLKLKNSGHPPLPVELSQLTPENYTVKEKKQIKKYLGEVRKKIWEKRKNIALKNERLHKDRKKKLGFNGVKHLKNTASNQRLEALMFNDLRMKQLYRVNHSFVQITSPVSQIPDSILGSAHFLSRVKRIGPVQVSTLGFNISVLWLFVCFGWLCLQFKLLQGFMQLFIRKRR